jgi:hypothetical protein
MTRVRAAKWNKIKKMTEIRPARTEIGMPIRGYNILQKDVKFAATNNLGFLGLNLLVCLRHEK